MNPLYQIPALFLTALCHTIVINHISEPKYSKKKLIIYDFLYIISFVGIGGYGYAIQGIPGLIAYMEIVIFLFLFSCIVSRDCFSKKCFLFITYFCLFSVLDNMLKLAVKIFLPQISEIEGFYVAIVLRSVALLLLLFLYKRYAVAVFHSLTVSGKRWWNLALTAFLFYLLQATVSYLNARNVMSNLYLFFAFIVISLVMCAVYGVVFSNISYMKKDSEAALIRQNAEYLSSRLAVLQNAEEINRRLRHDMRHHVDTIAEYAKTGDSSAILAYIREYGSEISGAAVKQYCVNRTVNSILSAYAGKAEENSINFSVRCNVEKELKMREIDIIALLANLFENALHGCQESGKENTGIEIHIRLQNTRLIILCNNTCPDDLVLSGGLPVGKGIGISSILAVCRKYDGNLDYRVEGEICSACAVLNL